MDNIELTEDQLVELRRAVVFRPVESKEALQNWLRVFLDVDLPDTIVDPTSNSCPMDILWLVYSKAMDGHDEDFQRVLAYASRDSYKSYVAAIMEVLMLVHLDRDVAHMAAIKPQARRVQKYVKKFLSSPYLKPFVMAKNDSEISVIRYMAPDGTAISEKEWSKLSTAEQVRYQFKSYSIDIVVATLSGTNSAHVSFMCLDELDVMTNRAAYEEAKAIPSPRDGKLPITFMTSSRKFSFGLVQDEIDKAEKTGTQIYHWNILDVTAKSIDQDTVLVTRDGISKKIKDLVPGDKLWGVNNSGNEIETEVFALYDHGTIDGYEIEFDDGYRVTSSLDHKFLTSKGQVPLREIINSGLGVFCGRSEKERWLEKTLRGDLFAPKGDGRQSSKRNPDRCWRQVGCGKSRKSCRERFEDVSDSEALKIGKVASRVQDADMGWKFDRLWNKKEAGRLCLSRRKDLGGGGWILPFLCSGSEKHQAGHGGTSCKGSVSGQYVEDRGFVSKGRDVDPSIDGVFCPSKWQDEAELAGMAYSHAPLSDTGDLVLRKVVSIRPVGPRRMYDLGVTHPKHNFLLPNGVVTSNCPEKRHLPLLPKISIWVDEENISALSAEQYLSLSELERAGYVVKEGYQGCLSKCKAFSYCQGRLATIDRKEESAYLKPIASVQQSMRQASAHFVNAQYLCKKPSSEGLVYTHFNSSKHCKLPFQIKELVSGEPADPKMTKADLIEYLKTVEGKWYAGYDWGFTHNFAAVLGFKHGYTLYLIDAVVEPGLDATEKVEACDKRAWKSFSPTGFPDPESPSDIKTFKKSGYTMREWSKGAGSVMEGIEIVRAKLRPIFDREPQVYFLKTDHHLEQNTNDDLERVIWAMEHYHWKQDKNQKSTKEADEEGADECDALRYLIMNVFPIKKDVTVYAPEVAAKAPTKIQAPTFWDQISGDLGLDFSQKVEKSTTSINTGRKGKWIISE